ncbi:MAG TPA: hypothetical protein VHK69_07965, partial [Chitinophagaceae bacterium]|nr:hypothetical protein [Chitinophagaceae bacterium]
MSAKKFCVLIEDDWEILGNGLGNVAHHQYLPSLFFMKLAKRLDIRMTFMVEVVQQLVFRAHQDKDYNLVLQQRLWDDTVLLMKQYGFDVQLHLHPQWHNALLKDDLFYLGKSWNIGQYDREIQDRIITESVNYLEELIRPVDPSYKVIAFKGGSWGLQPSGNLLQALSANGIRIVMGVRKGMHIPQNAVDYRTLEEQTLPYYPNFSDLNKVSDKEEDIVVIPMQPYSAGIGPLASLGWDALKRKIGRSDSVRYYYEQSVPQEITHLSPLLKDKAKLKLGLKPY